MPFTWRHLSKGSETVVNQDRGAPKVGGGGGGCWAAVSQPPKIES
jgi:hypothetical protein